MLLEQCSRFRLFAQSMCRTLYLYVSQYQSFWLLMACLIIVALLHHRGHLYRFDDFLTAWSEKLRTKEPTSMTVRLQKDVDKYKVELVSIYRILHLIISVKKMCSGKRWLPEDLRLFPKILIFPKIFNCCRKGIWPLLTEHFRRLRTTSQPPHPKCIVFESETSASDRQILRLKTTTKAGESDWLDSA